MKERKVIVQVVKWLRRKATHGSVELWRVKSHGTDLFLCEKSLCSMCCVSLLTKPLFSVWANHQPLWSFFHWPNLRLPPLVTVQFISSNIPLYKTLCVVYILCTMFFRISRLETWLVTHLLSCHFVHGFLSSRVSGRPTVSVAVRLMLYWQLVGRAHKWSTAANDLGTPGWE